MRWLSMAKAIPERRSTNKGNKSFLEGRSVQYTQDVTTKLFIYLFFATQHLFHPFKSAPWIPLEELLLLQHGLLHGMVNFMSCPPSEVKNQLRSLFMNFESCTKWQRMKKGLTFTLSRLEDGVIPVALVPAYLLQLPIHSFNSHSFIQYPSN